MPLRVARPSRSPALVAIGAAVALSALVTSSAICQESAEGYIDKMAKAAGGTYEARQLVVYLGEPQSSAIVEIHASAGQKFVKASHGQDVTRIWRNASSGRVAGSKISLTEQSPASLPISPSDIRHKFEVAVGQPTSVTGMNLVPLDLLRRSDKRMVERLWVEPDSGMVYRRELFGSNGNVLGMTTMLEMKWGDAGVTESPDPAEPEAVTAASGERPQPPSKLPYGYRLVSERAMLMGRTQAVQWLYSDGLHTLSVFNHRANVRRPDGYSEVALKDTTAWAGPGPGTWVWQGGRNAFTVVADETQLDPAVLIRGLPQGGPSRMARMGSWWASGFHWVADRF